MVQSRDRQVIVLSLAVDDPARPTMREGVGRGVGVQVAPTGVYQYATPGRSGPNAAVVASIDALTTIQRHMKTLMSYDAASDCCGSPR